MLLPLLQFVKFRPGPGPSFLVDLYAKYFRNVFLFGFALAVCRQLFGDTIVCQNSETSSLSPMYVETRCFLNGTVTLDPVTRNTVMTHDYYQWVPVLLLLASFHFHFPLQIWCRAFGSYADFIRGAKDEASTRQVVNAVGKLQGLFWKTWMLECFYLMHSFMGIWLLDTFFNNVWSQNSFTTAGTIKKLFPEHGVCLFRYVAGSAEKEAKILCLLPLNSVYRKLFVVVFETFKLLTAVHGLLFCHRLWLICRIGLTRIDGWWTTRIAIHSAETWTARCDLEEFLDSGETFKEAHQKCLSA